MNKTERHIRYMAIVIMVVAFPLKVSAQWNFDIVSVEAYINDHKQQRSLLLARSTLELNTGTEQPTPARIQQRSGGGLQGTERGFGQVHKGF